MKIEYREPDLALKTWKKIKRSGLYNIPVFLEASYQTGGKISIHLPNEVVVLHLVSNSSYPRISGDRILKINFNNFDYRSAALRELLRECYIDYYRKNIGELQFVFGSGDTEFVIDTVYIRSRNNMEHRVDLFCHKNGERRCIQYV